MSAIKLYYHPVSTTAPPVTLFAAEHALPLDLQVVDLYAGQNLEPAFVRLRVPAVEQELRAAA